MLKATGPTPFYVQVRKMNLRIPHEATAAPSDLKHSDLLTRNPALTLARVRVWAVSSLWEMHWKIILSICSSFPVLIHKYVLGECNMRFQRTERQGSIKQGVCRDLSMAGRKAGLSLNPGFPLLLLSYRGELCNGQDMHTQKVPKWYQKVPTQ